MAAGALVVGVAAGAWVEGVAAVAPDVAGDVVTALGERGVPAWVAGTVGARTGADAARLVGSYR